MACYYLFIFLPHKFKFVSIKTVMIFVSTHVRDTYRKNRKSVSQRKLIIKINLPIWHLRIYFLGLVKNVLSPNASTLPNIYFFRQAEGIVCCVWIVFVRCNLKINNCIVATWSCYFCQIWCSIYQVLKLIKQGNLPHSLICVK